MKRSPKPSGRAQTASSTTTRKPWSPASFAPRPTWCSTTRWLTHATTTTLSAAVMFWRRSTRQPGVPEAPRRLDQLARGEADPAGSGAHQRVGGAAVQVHAQHERGFARIALGEERHEQAREHIPHARARHAGITAGVDEPVPVARRDHAAVSLEHRVGIEMLRQIA